MINGNDILNLGIPEGPLVGKALQIDEGDDEMTLDTISLIWETPHHYAETYEEGAKKRFAGAVKQYRERQALREARDPLNEPIAYASWGLGTIEEGAIEQMQRAMRLPVTRAGALMPDAHRGYGLPVGGVMALENAVSPYAVGVDISCSMALSLFPDDPNRILSGHKEKTIRALQQETAFGVGCGFDDRRDHPIMDDPRWDTLPMIGHLKNKAWYQLGSSGGGNHFVEFGLAEIQEPLDSHHGTIEPGVYLALLSHSGSRGLGYKIASRYSDVAKNWCYGLPKAMKHLAWMDLDAEEGQAYWELMHFARDYALANHELIHEHVARAAGVKSTFYHAHSHNLAWKEEHDGKELIVHRKGATPAHNGQFGLIPGTMGDKGYIVRGKGNEQSLCSSSHGAGRAMSRTAAKNTLTKSSQKQYLAERGITLLGGGVDEHPLAYKRIDDVMDEQVDLVDIAGTFAPKIVRMADDS